MSPNQPRLRLFNYFAVEAICAFAGILFLYCAFFWTKKKFGYSPTENLLLTATHGFTYIFASKYGGRIADRWGYDRMLSLCSLGLAAVLLLGWIPDWRWTPFVVVALFTLFIGPVWPSLEAAVLHCPGSTSMPNRLGFYNITWASGDALGFAVSALFFKWNPDSILWIAGLFYLVKWLWLQLGSRHSSTEGEVAMDMPHSGDDVPREVKRRFMHTAWMANGLGFLMLAGLVALTPQIGESLGLSEEMTIWLTSSQLFARAASFAICWKWEGWHYHRGWSLGALWLAPVSLAAAFFIHNSAVVFVSLAIFGLAHGLSYSGSLYYSLDYGENKGEHGGLHEAILGIGIFVGPLLAALVSSRNGGTFGAQWTIVGLPILFNFVVLKWLAQMKHAR